MVLYNIAGVVMQDADLYLKSVDFCRYWPSNSKISCQDFMNRIAAGKVNVDEFPFLTTRQIQLFKLVLEAWPNFDIPHEAKIGSSSAKSLSRPRRMEP